jgi:hypothetical protein
MGGHVGIEVPLSIHHNRPHAHQKKQKQKNENRNKHLLFILAPLKSSILPNIAAAVHSLDGTSRANSTPFQKVQCLA